VAIFCNVGKMRKPDLSTRPAVVKNGCERDDYTRSYVFETV